MTVVAVLLALTLMALLFSRIHFHFSFSLRLERPTARKSKPMATRREAKRRELCSVVPAVRSISESDRAESDIRSALLNLGCEKGKAIQVAQMAMGQGKDFDSRLQWALRNAA